jgi:hypothetical protein
LVGQGIEEEVTADDFAQLTGLTRESERHESSNVLIHSLNRLTGFPTTSTKFGSEAFHLVYVAETVPQQFDNIGFYRISGNLPQNLSGVAFETRFKMKQPIADGPRVVCGTVFEFR